jgi:hypothetical protein
MNKRKILNDPVYGFITLPSDLIFDLIEHRFFQRLRRIKQVGLTHYVYPGALHTRFQHAIGAMHLMGQAIHTLRTKGHQITEVEEEAALVAILLHDIGHGPYSHALEHLLLPLSHEEITLMFMHLLNDEFEDRLALAIQIFEGSYPRKFLNQLVSGQLDMDRLDYLKRDSFFTGVAEGEIGHDRIIAMLNVVDDEIVVEEKGLFSVENFLVSRRIMYLQVYLHKAVISAEQMLRRVISVLRKEVIDSKIPIPDSIHTLLMHQDITTWKSQSEMIEVFGGIDDVEIDYVLKQLMRSSHQILCFLSTGLVNRKLFRTIFSDHPIPPSHVQEAIAEVTRMLNINSTDATELVITGRESVPTYDPTQGEIRILRKDTSIVNLPQLLEDHENPRLHHRYYLCHPVKHVLSTR